MKKETKQQIRQEWRNRLLVGVGSVVVIGFSVLQVQAVLKHRTGYPSWALRLSESVRILTNDKSSIEEIKQAKLKIRRVSRPSKLKLPTTRSIVHDSTLAQELALLQAKVQGMTLEQNQLQTVRELPTTWALILEEIFAQGTTPDQALSTVQRMHLESKILEIQLEQDLALERALVLDQDWDLIRVQNQDLVWTQSWDLNLALDQNQKLTQEMAQALILEKNCTRIMTLYMRQKDLLALTIEKELEQVYGLKLQRGIALDQLLHSEPERETAFVLSQLLLTLFSYLLLILLIRLQLSYNLPPTGQLIAFLPEEFIAELGVLQRRMKKAKVPLWQIRLRLLTEFITLLWAFYIQITLENLWLPSGDHREIDD